MKKEELIAFLTSLGWELDRYGHLQKDVTNRHRETKELITRRMRIKLQATSCRIEVKSSQKNFDGGYDWIRVGGEYYSKILKLDDGRIRVGTYFFGVKNASISSKP